MYYSEDRRDDKGGKKENVRRRSAKIGEIHEGVFARLVQTRNSFDSRITLLLEFFSQNHLVHYQM